MANPTITSITPNYGATIGGTTVTIVGTGFQFGGFGPHAEVTFGGVSCTEVLITTTSITCTSPPHALGQVDIAITNPDGGTVTQSLGFRYIIVYPNQEGMTLTAFRQRAAREFGPFLASTVTLADSLSITDATWPVLSTLDQDQFWADKFLFRPSASVSDQVRLVKNYLPNQGLLEVDTPYTVTPSVGEAYELHALVDPREMTTLINEALRHCFMTLEFTVAPIQNAFRHSLANYAPWLTNSDWVRTVGLLANQENREQIDPYTRIVRGNLRLYPSGTTMVPYIETPGQYFDSNNETIYVLAISPGYFQCVNASGTPQYGLSLESDICPLNKEWVASRTLVEGWRKFDNLMEAAANQRLLKDEGQAAAWFTEMSEKCFRLPPLDFRPLRSAGPRLTGFGPAWGNR